MQLYSHLRSSAFTAFASLVFTRCSEHTLHNTVTPPGDESEIEAAFTFERENLNVNDLRILIANDLFRAQHTPLDDENTYLPIPPHTSPYLPISPHIS